MLQRLHLLNEAASHYLLEHETTLRATRTSSTTSPEGFRGTIYRQCMFAEFERDISQMNFDGVALNAEVLSERYGKLCAEYFGPGIELDEEIKLEWSRTSSLLLQLLIPVLFRQLLPCPAHPFRGRAMVKDYIGYLSGGCSKTN